MAEYVPEEGHVPQKKTKKPTTRSAQKAARVAKTKCDAPRIRVRRAEIETWRLKDRAEVEKMDADMLAGTADGFTPWRRDRLTALTDGTGNYLAVYSRTKAGGTK